MRLEYFRLIDRIIAIDLSARTIEVEANVPGESTIFEGHFPDYPLMPGVLLLETMAQASGWLIIGVTKFTRMPFFVAVKEAKFRSFVVPGTMLTVSAAIEHEGSGYVVTRAEIRRAATVVCNCEITFRLAQFPSAHFRDAMHKVAGEIAFPMESVNG